MLKAEGQRPLPQPQSLIPSGLSQNLTLDAPETLTESQGLPKHLCLGAEAPEGAGRCGNG